MAVLIQPPFKPSYDVSFKIRNHHRIHFQGYIDDPRILLSQADWHIAPSICEEAFGNVVLEAKQIGIPSVISKNGGLPELVEEGVDGFVLDEVSSQSIENQINSLFECKADWKKMGASAKTSLQRSFRQFL